ncbi:MAG: ABC transporter permease, partial [Bacteroidales bacterium]|nr:ABC transporter permease [Bacteroidales bacterium]
VPQDDLLIEELTVYQNLYYNAKLCFGGYSEDELNATVEKVLKDLGLYDIKDFQVGDPLNKMISGGQRKRLNIGLELMREPVILLIDEPTSGLSSSDSEKVMQLLKNQALRGKLVFAVIHQPSSDILKMFDRLWILDKGGYMIYDGDPVEALVYFKTETSQANAAESECPNCGNIDTENILHIVEVKVIDNSGMEGKERQISPSEWYEKYRRKMMAIIDGQPAKAEIPKSNFKVPEKLEQIKTFLKRNVKRKLADRQYMLLTLLETPLLALILGFISKYSENGVYVFSANKNYYIFLFMSVIVALFIGLTVSAEEIFRDRKILEREKYLNISRLSYLLSKIAFLFLLSAIQSLFFVIVANNLLEVKGMYFQQWLILFSTACFGNILGLNISSGMRTAVSIYILIPLLLVPMLILGGAMIRFDDLHKSMTRKVYVPVIGDIMATRWAYEALMVEMFKSNRFEKPFFEYDMEISHYDWVASFLLPALRVKVDECRIAGNDPRYRYQVENNLAKISYHIDELTALTNIVPGKWKENLYYTKFNNYTAEAVRVFLDSVRSDIRAHSRAVSLRRDSLYNEIKNQIGEEGITKLRNENYNENIANVVLNRLHTNKIYDSEKKFIQKADPVFMKPGSRYGRAHFYAPYKQLGSLKIETLIFNALAIWLMILVLFVTLYYDVLKRFIVLLESLNIPIWRKFGRELLQG